MAATKLLGVPEVAELLGVAKSEVYRLTERGKLPHFKAGKYLKYDQEEILEAIRRPFNGESGDNGRS
jgi:excisionase family DNA binding protein